MQKLAKLTIKTVERSARKDPVLERRSKLLDKLNEQFYVLEAAHAGESYTKTKTVWVTNSEGQRVQTQRTRAVRAWFFQQDGGWYVQCRYGTKSLKLGDKGNAVFVQSLEEVEHVLSLMRDAVIAGEMDDAIVSAYKEKLSAGVPRKKARA